MQLFFRLFKGGVTPLRGVQKILDQARRDKSRVSLYLGEPPEPEPAAEALISQAHDDTLTLDITRGAISDSWHGAPANCALLLAEAPGHTPRLLHFSATVMDTGTGGRLVLSRPQAVNAIEQRTMQRISLPEEFMPRIKGWTSGPGAPDDALLPPLGSTPLFQLDAADEPSLRLRDISAGGLRLSVHASLLQRPGVHATPDARLLLWLALPEPMWKNPLEYCFPARITRNNPQPMGWRDLGLHFLLFSGGVKHPDSNEWKPLVEDDIPDLANWVNRRMDELRGRAT